MVWRELRMFLTCSSLFNYFLITTFIILGETRNCFSLKQWGEDVLGSDPVSANCAFSAFNTSWQSQLVHPCISLIAGGKFNNSSLFIILPLVNRVANGEMFITLSDYCDVNFVYSILNFELYMFIYRALYSTNKVELKAFTHRKLHGHTSVSVKYVYKFNHLIIATHSLSLTHCIYSHSLVSLARPWPRGSGVWSACGSVSDTLWWLFRPASWRKHF